MRQKVNFRVTLPMFIVTIAISIVIAVIYIKQLNNTVSNNIIQNITELSLHDQNNIRNNSSLHE